MTLRALRTRNFLTSVCGILQVDGSAVGTTAGQDGLLKGKHIATIKKGTSTDDNLFTIALKKPFGLAPAWFAQPITTLLQVREDATVPTLDTIKVRCFAADLSTREPNGDFYLFIIGTPDIREGNYV